MPYFDAAFPYSPYYIKCLYIMRPHYIRIKCVLNKVIDLTAGSTYFPWNTYSRQCGWSFSYKLPEFIWDTWLSSTCISNLKILSFKNTQPFDFLLYVYLIWKLSILKIQISWSYIRLLSINLCCCWRRTPTFLFVLIVSVTLFALVSYIDQFSPPNSTSCFLVVVSRILLLL